MKQIILKQLKSYYKVIYNYLYFLTIIPLRVFLYML